MPQCRIWNCLAWMTKEDQQQIMSNNITFNVENDIWKKYVYFFKLCECVQRKHKIVHINTIDDEK